jgi:hypothetical protein
MSHNKKIQELKIENANLHQRIHDLQESFHQEARRMRGDPTYWASGRYSFTTAYKDRYFHVDIRQGHVMLIEKHKDHDMILQGVPPGCPVDQSSNNRDKDNG